jgi:uncharacterized protein
MRPFRIAVDHQTVAGRLLLPAESGDGWPAALFIHGWGGSQRQDLGAAKQLVGLGWACLTFNLRGHARTRHQRDMVTRADNLQDALAAYDALAAVPGIDAARVGVVGSSYGGYLAMLLTAERKVRWLALRAPALYKDADFDRPKRELNLDADLPAYRRRALGPADNRALRSAAAFAGDVLVVESEHDTVIPGQVLANYLKSLSAAQSVTHKIIAGADHGLTQSAWQREYGRLVSDWLVGGAGDLLHSSLPAPRLQG